MNEPILNRGIGGLIPPKKSDRAYSFGAILKYASLSELPESYLIDENPIIHDQKDTDYCTAFMVVAMRQFQEGVKLSPEFQFAQTKKIMGSWQEWGADPKNASKAAILGLLEYAESPFTLEAKGRDFCANWENWPETYTELAKKHLTQAYFWIGESGGMEMFDAIRSALWRFKDEKRAVGVGALWRTSWVSKVSKDHPFIPTRYENDGTPHAFTVIGWENDFLVLQLSSGTQYGKNGIVYMPREVANKELIFSMMFSDIPKGMDKEDVLYLSSWYRSGFFKKILLLLGFGPWLWGRIVGYER